MLTPFPSTSLFILYIPIIRVEYAQDFSRDEFSSHKPMASHFHMLLLEKYKKSLWKPLLHFFFLRWSNFIYMMVKNCSLPFLPLPIHFVYTYNLLSLYRVACAQNFSRDEFSSHKPMASHFHMLLLEKHKKSLWEPLLHFFP